MSARAARVRCCAHAASQHRDHRWRVPQQFQVAAPKGVMKAMVEGATVTVVAVVLQLHENVTVVADVL